MTARRDSAPPQAVQTVLCGTPAEIGLWMQKGRERRTTARIGARVARRRRGVARRQSGATRVGAGRRGVARVGAGGLVWLPAPRECFRDGEGIGLGRGLAGECAIAERYVRSERRDCALTCSPAVGEFLNRDVDLV
jgi:hypothetical protein